MSVIQSVELPASASNGIGADAKYEREYAAFRRMQSDLMQTHFGQYVAIHNGQVIASGAERANVVDEALSKTGGAAIHVGRVGPDPVPTSRSGLMRETMDGVRRVIRYRYQNQLTPRGRLCKSASSEPATSKSPPSGLAAWG